MLRLNWSDDGGSSGSLIAPKFPLLIGRGVSADLRLEAAGVWDEHLFIARDTASGKFVARASGEAFFLVDGARLQEKTLKPGDLLQLGSVRLAVTLAPPKPVPLKTREAVVWSALFFVLVLEILLALAVARPA